MCTLVASREPRINAHVDVRSFAGRAVESFVRCYARNKWLFAAAAVGTFVVGAAKGVRCFNKNKNELLVKAIGRGAPEFLKNLLVSLGAHTNTAAGRRLLRVSVFSDDDRTVRALFDAGTRIARNKHADIFWQAMISPQCTRTYQSVYPHVAVERRLLDEALAHIFVHGDLIQSFSKLVWLIEHGARISDEFSVRDGFRRTIIALSPDSSRRGFLMDFFGSYHNHVQSYLRTAAIHGTCADMADLLARYSNLDPYSSAGDGHTSLACAVYALRSDIVGWVLERADNAADVAHARAMIDAYEAALENGTYERRFNASLTAADRAEIERRLADRDGRQRAMSAMKSSLAHAVKRVLA